MAMNYKNGMFTVPLIERRAGTHAGMVFSHLGRSLRVIKSYGDDKAAPVICEELASFGPSTLKGQLGLWCNDAIVRRRK